MPIPRRNVLIRGIQLFGAALLPGTSFPLARLYSRQDSLQSGDSSHHEELTWYSTRYLTAEMPLRGFDSWITPTELFFVRNNLLMPDVALDRWRLRITGEVLRPIELTFQELQQLRVERVTNTLECAGNGRAFFHPRIAGVPWLRGAVGNAVFSGPALRILLERSGLKPTARHVAFKGLDVVPQGAQEFIRSIPIGKALEPTTLVATRMNGTALTPEHGFPARALVPGWIGSCSIKSLCEIRVLKDEFDGFYMSSAYRLPSRSSSSEPSRTQQSAAITSLVVKSVVAHPQDGATILVPSSGVVSVGGAAWAGERQIQKVEVSTDAGRSWHYASLTDDPAKYSWRLWRYDWHPTQPGGYVLQSRARDQEGRVQPLEPRWNQAGYLWNGIDQVHITVKSA